MQWVKSSFSFSNGNCVEVAARPAPQGTEHLVRDSKNPSGPVLTFTAAAWAAFVRDVKAGPAATPGPRAGTQLQAREEPRMTNEPGPWLGLETCRGCDAAPGTNHGAECDWARCPECGEQLIMCSEHADSDRPARWHGVDQRAEVARKLNWWTTAVGIDHLVEDYTRVLFADGLEQITWDPEAQRYVIGQINEAAIDLAMSRG
jgi:Domain of unknown function (DUF397)